MPYQNGMGSWDVNIKDIQVCDTQSTWDSTCVPSQTYLDKTFTSSSAYTIQAGDKLGMLMDATGSDDDNFVQMYYQNSGITTTSLSSSAGSDGDCTLNDNASFAEHDGRTVLQLDGSNDTCSMGSNGGNNNVMPSGEFTAGGWIWRDSNQSSHEQLIRLQNSAGSSGGELRIQNHNSDSTYESKLACNFGSGTDYGSTAVPTGEWVHWACSWGGSGAGKVYYNGVEERNGSVSHLRQSML